MLSPEGAQDFGRWGRGSLKTEPSLKACVCPAVLTSSLQSVPVYLLVLTVETAFSFPPWMAVLSPRLAGRTGSLDILDLDWFASSCIRHGDFYHFSDGSSQACCPFAIAPGSSPTFSAACPHAGPSEQGRGLSWAARRLLDQSAEPSGCQAQGESTGSRSSRSRGKSLLCHHQLGGPDEVRGLQDCCKG